MTEATLDPSQSKLLGALTIAAVTHLADDTGVIDADGQLKKCRIMRVGDVALVDLPADDSGPRCINCYSVEAERFDAIDGRKFKIDPQHLVYSLRWLHKAEPPDFELVLLRDPELWERWVSGASLMLLAELWRRAPHAIDWTGMPDVVQMLDDFQSHMEAKRARRH